jgi:hypothetical protein
MPAMEVTVPKPTENRTPQSESWESDNQAHRNAGVDEGHQGHISPSARKREDGTSLRPKQSLPRGGEPREDDSWKKPLFYYAITVSVSKIWTTTRYRERVNFDRYPTVSQD